MFCQGFMSLLLWWLNHQLAAAARANRFSAEWQFAIHNSRWFRDCKASSIQELLTARHRAGEYVHELYHLPDLAAKACSHLLTTWEHAQQTVTLLLCESLRHSWKDVSGDEGNDKSIKTSVGCALTCCQDQKEIVRFGPKKELNQTSNKNLSAQILVLNLFQTCFLLLLKQLLQKQKLAVQRLDRAQCKAFQCSIQTASQAIAALRGRKTVTISSAYIQLLSTSLV